MTKQYTILAALLLIAGLILNSVIGQGGISRQQASNSGSEPSVAATSNGQSGVDSLFADLSAGGISRSPSKTQIKPNVDFNSDISLASGSPFGVASSTPFSMGSNANNPFSIALERADHSTDLRPASSRNLGQTFRSREVKLRSEPSLSAAPKDSEDNKPLSEAKQDSLEEAEVVEEKQSPTISSNVLISGRVVDTAGRYVRNLPLKLSLLKAAAEDKLLFNNRTLNTNTDEKGYYKFANLVEGDYQLCTLEALGYPSSCQRPHAPHTATDFTLLITNNGHVFGVVTDQLGKPLKDVSVSAVPGQKNRTKSDAQGKYEIPVAVSADRSYQLYFTKKDFQRRRVSFKGAEAIARKQIDAKLEPTLLSGFDVLGKVVDEQGNPLRGRTVKLYSPSIKVAYPMQGTTDKNGQFVIQYVKASDDFRMTINTRGGYVFDSTSYQKISIYEGVPDFLLRMKNVGTGSLQAQVTNTSGVPQDGITFRLLATGSVLTSTTHDGGQLEFDEVPATQGKASIYINNTTIPRYIFSGIQLAAGEHKGGLNLRIDKGDYF